MISYGAIRVRIVERMFWKGRRMLKVLQQIPRGFMGPEQTLEQRLLSEDQYQLAECPASGG